MEEAIVIESLTVSGRIYGESSSPLKLYELSDTQQDGKTDSKENTQDRKDKKDRMLPKHWVTVFGQNGSGKSTLSHALWNYANGDEVSKNNCEDDMGMSDICTAVLSPINGVQKDHIFVFNDDFLQNKIRFAQNENLDAVVMLDDQPSLQDDIDTKIGTLKELHKDMTRCKYLQGIDSETCDLDVSDLVSLPEQLEAIERKIKKV
jgi:energy-coupling factor transporter ATP-binding protein EcfA2